MIKITDEQILSEALNVFNIEISAIKSISERVGQNFIKAVRLILNSSGNVIFSGVGKSGHIGRKLAATLSSTGTTSYFVHSDEAAHGDLGMIRRGDVFIGISFSGESSELMTIIPALRALEIPIIAMTGRADSSLAKVADVALITPIEREACPLNLAPTASTTVTMVLGDAIAGALMVAKGFNSEDFARSHPAGALGRRLLLKVENVMKPLDKTPVVNPDDSALDAITLMTKYHLGCFVIAEKNRAAGIFTEGDLSRTIRARTDFETVKAKEIMTPSPKSVKMSDSAYEAMQAIRENKINQLVVLNDDDELVGIVHVQDLIAAKVS